LVSSQSNTTRGRRVRQGVNVETRPVSGPPLEIPSAIAVQGLSELMRASGIEVIKQLMRRGVMANINQVIDYETASIIASDFGFSPQQEESRETGIKDAVDADAETEEDLEPRAPIVTILGHVDHGKTSLLDVIRDTSVTASEKGGITQHIGAYQVGVDGQPVTFLDTPGHEAFTAMRARGAQVTDIAVLVVAADDGVMPQTREAIDHAKAAEVPIIVALNKMDVPGANPDRVKQQLSEVGLIAEEWGGDTIVVPLSAKTQEGVNDLLENIVLVAEVAELKSNPEGKARAVVVEAKLDTARGPIATVLVQSGTLKSGDRFFAGDIKGKVRALFDYQGQKLAEAGPAVPVEVLGFDSVPRTGDILVAAETGRKGTSAAERRERQMAARDEGPGDAEALLAQVRVGYSKEFNVILKTDVEGSGEALRSALEDISTDEVVVKVIRTSSGIVTETDVLLASASDAVILAFNTRDEAGARRLADIEDVDIRHYDIIYDMLDYVTAAVSGMLEPVYRETVEARAIVKEVFEVKGGKVAGIGVGEGRVNRNALIRVMRNGNPVYEGRIKSLRHFKDNVREIASGSEGGLGLEGFDDFEAGDELVALRKDLVTSPSS